MKLFKTYVEYFTLQGQVFVEAENFDAIIQGDGTFGEHGDKWRKSTSYSARVGATHT